MFRSRWAAAVAVAVLPWSWFVLRDLGFPFDLAATALPVLLALVAAGIGVLAAARRRAAPVVVVVSTVLAGSVAVVEPWRPQPVPPPVPAVRIVAANVDSKNPARQRAIADALAQGGDLVLLLEAGRAGWTPPPGYTAVNLPSYSRQVVLSRFPARLLDRPRGWPKRLRAHRVEVDAPGGRMVVYLAHLVRPRLGPRRIIRIRSQLQAQRREREALLASARGESAPVVLAGDFNLSDRSSGYRRITGRFGDAMRSRWAGPTYVAPLWRPFLLRIDHVFIPRHWCSADPTRFSLHGSDHRGLAVDVGPCPGL